MALLDPVVMLNRALDIRAALAPSPCLGLLVPPP